MPNNVSHSIFTSAGTTVSDSAITVVAAQGSKIFKHMMLINPSGSAAGQWSDDGFNKNIFPFPAGPSGTLLNDGGALPEGIQIRRIAGQSNVSGAFIVVF